MSESTGVHVHPSRYPLRVLKRLVPSTSSSSSSSTSSPSYVRRLDPLFRYEAGVEATSNSTSSNSKGKGREVASTSSKPRVEPYYGGNQEEEPLSPREIFTFESPVEGTVCEWCVGEGTVLTDPERPILRILEPCKHPVQLGGLCAVCGKDLTGVDYTGFSETSRASISMAHDTSNLTVSLEEAARIERQTTTRLQKEKKLSLIVDLDQTVIHATVDPTVGDWMHDERNPNYDVLQDVRRFKLLNEAGQEEGCWYYVKPRPTLKTFLEETSKMYEMHVYTMGTRAYAENVCRIIDPERKIFANRILSRDESGSLSHKSLQRLFPVDQSMVVVIDDRGDVWDWSPNLVKVVPYDFFVGIGDINSAFLPKVKSALPSSIASPSSSSSSSSSSITGSSKSTPPTPAQSEQEETAAAINAQNEDLDHQIIDKPLARMQEEKSAMIHEKQEAAAAVAGAKSASASPMTSAADSRSPTEEPNGSITTSESKAVPSVPASSAASTAKPAQLSPLASTSPKPATANGSGISSSRFVSKMKTDDDASDSDSEDDDDDEEEEDLASEAEIRAIAAGQPRTATNVDPRSSGLDEDGKRPQSISISAAPNTQDTTVTATDGNTEMSDAAGEPTSSQVEQEKEAVLHDNDSELDRVLKILSDVHMEYYDGSKGRTEGGVETIITDIKSHALEGCNIVFSGVFPLDQEPSSSEVWRLALQFGASCSTALQKHTTHVVAAKSGTSKVHQARRRPNVHIVYPSWLLESVAQWRREPEEDHVVELEPGESEQPSMPNTPTSFPDSPAPEPPDGSSKGGAEVDELAGMDDDGGDDSLHVDWGDAAAEIAAFLDETDDNDDGMVSGDNTADESDADSLAGGGGSKNRNKRQRSSPSSSSSGKTSTSSSTSGPTESPLAKRRKVAAARAGNSRLRVSESIDMIDAGTTVSSSSASQASSPAARSNGGDGEGTTSSDDDDLDDFAKALEGELS